MAPCAMMLLALAARSFAAEAAPPKAPPAAAIRASCVKRLSKGKYAEPSTFERLRACQRQEYESFLQKDRTPEQIDAFEDSQREEARGYLARHAAEPLRASPGKDEPVKDEAADAQRIKDGEDEQFEALKADVTERSDGGKQGITPEAAQRMRSYLLKKQGGVSPEMDGLLRSTAKDGGSLTRETMLQLQHGAREAKGAGLDLGIDPGTEKNLLEDPLEPPNQPGAM